MERIQTYYEPASLEDRLRMALGTDGVGARKLTAADLAPLDQFHSRGLAATVELAQALQIDQSTTVLDIGSGLGGPSRYLADTHGCRVEGIDLSRSFVDAARLLAERTGLTGKVHYSQGNALALPFADGSFDIAWTQHVAMNIADRTTFYREAFRVLRPGGRLAIYDVVAGANAPLHYPVPWAQTAETSFLVTAEQMRNHLLEQGFRISVWTDCTEAGAAWFQERQRNQQAASHSTMLGLHVIMGADFGEATRNLGRNLAEARAGLMQVIAEKA